MPQITVSDDLYRQLKAESPDKDIDDTLWTLVWSSRSENDPV
jgi:hypothetical protein